MKNKYKLIRKIRKNGTSLAINIPKEIVEIMNIKEGELIEIEISKI
ncbi:AbrB/MazE/SpoVT family DNA-binding domain-containing protein [Candidatus Pacearchaeota archaeon]|nr:AbrB/MazE/SpoVT family DNA-binding domain-containing protein [Candidatus Pacearchaeota archaeon]